MAKVPRPGVPGALARVQPVSLPTEQSTRESIEMDDGARLATWTSGQVSDGSLSLVMVHGGPGLPDYLGPVAAMVADLCRVHRYDQRGTGESLWDGEHTIARHIRDLELLLDAWGHDRAVLVGHSFGTDLVSFFLLAHPERVAAIVYLSGPFLGPWRDPTRAIEVSRRSPRQQARLEALGAAAIRSDAEEVEFLTLSWFPDHADQQRAVAWAHDAAQKRRPINYSMNTQLNADKRRVSLELQVERLQALVPAATTIIGGEDDPRPASFLRDLADRFGCDVTIIPDAGHEPWLEQPTAFRAALRSAVRTYTVNQS